MTLAAADPLAPSDSPPPRAAFRDVSKRFGATQALDGVSFEILPGEVHALVGENGAGKSTLVKLLAGLFPPDSGAVLLDGRAQDIHGAAQARSLGIAVVHQEPSLFPDLSIAENVFLGHQPVGRFGSIDWGAMRRAADALFDELGVRLDVSAPVRGLSMADQQLIEIARALSIDARVLVLDEPTASLSAHEVDRLFVIARQARARGVGVLFVNHRLEEVFELSDRVTVLRDGRLVVTAPSAGLTPRDLIRHMVGRDVAMFPKSVATPGEVLLEVEELSRAGEFEDVSFTVRTGEIVGFAGLIGAGRTEVARVLFGVEQPDRGVIRLAGQQVSFASPAAAIRAGIAYVPEDRHQEGLVLDFSIAENVTIPILARLFPHWFVHRSIESALARDYGQQLSVRPPEVEREVSALSGGNQQKVVVAKWLATQPRVLVLDEPTRGIDVAAKAEVHRIIGDLATRGLAIVLISSDLPEVLAMADRILVMHDGRIAAELSRSEATEELVMLAATGQDATPAQVQVADHGPGQVPDQGTGQAPDQAITGAPQ
jgi:rhamnose transport system ATP-binding protein